MIQQQTILNQVFRSTAFNSDEIYAAASEEFFKLIDSELKAGKVTQVAIPRFDGNFINNFDNWVNQGYQYAVMLRELLPNDIKVYYAFWKDFGDKNWRYCKAYISLWSI